MTELISELIASLDDEIEALSRGGSQNQRLAGGRQISTAGGVFSYSFQAPADFFLPDDSPVVVQIAGSDIDGSIVSVSDSVVIIALEEDLGFSIPEATVKFDESILVKRLKSRLEQVNAGSDSHFRDDLPLKLVNRAGIRTSVKPVPPEAERPLADSKPLNAEQQHAIASCFGSDVSYLWGPPGTGKTTVLASLIDAFRRNGQSVLVVSNTNVAVDTALEKAWERASQLDHPHEGEFLRIGTIQKPELKEHSNKLQLDEVADSLGATWRAELDKIESSIRELESEKTNLAGVLQRIADHETVALDIEALESRIRTSQAEYDRARRMIASLENSLSSIELRIDEAQKKSGLMRWISGTTLTKLESERMALATQQRSAQANFSRLPPEIDSLENRLRSLRDRFSELGNLIGDYRNTDQVRRRIPQIESDLIQFEHKRNDLNQKLENLRRDLISKAKVIAATVYQTFLKGRIDRKFDAVIVDEVSMISVPMLFYTAGLAASSVVVAGDFRQLPPIVRADSQLARKWLSRDIFDVSGVVDDVNRGVEAVGLLQLRRQYRMAPSINKVVSEIFYRGELEWHGPDEASDRIGSTGLLYVDSASLGPWVALKAGSYSRFNAIHALISRNLICQLIDWELIEVGQHGSREIGVVTPYAAQTQLLQALLSEKLGLGARGIANTVHRFQGNEKDVIVIDIPDSFGTRPSHFVTSDAISEAGARLFNVAISRAKTHVILIANFDWLKDRLDARSVLRRIVGHFEDYGEPLKWAANLWASPDDLKELIEAQTTRPVPVSTAGSSLYTEGTFYDAFKRDLIDAKKSIVIFSPFATQRGVARWMDLLRAKKMEGVAVRIITRPPDGVVGSLSPAAEELARTLPKAGMRVDFRNQMHEKIAIIDENLSWIGSLNILSHNDTAEVMLRIPDTSIGEQVGVLSGEPVARGDRSSPSELSEAENPLCEVHGLPSVRKQGRFGIYYECLLRCGWTFDRRRQGAMQKKRNRRKPGDSAGRPRTAAARIASQSDRRCPEHRVALMQKSGRYGTFYGCPRYPACKYTEN